MNFRILVPFSMAATFAYAQSAMKPNPSPASSPVHSSAPQCSADPEKSACGLPSNVVIDLAGTKVRHTDAEWKQLLTPLQFKVARQQGTEPPFHNEFWNNHADGVYFSVCSDTPLFDSRDKFESGTGWPSFTKAVDPHFVDSTTDGSYGMVRTEVHCSVDGAHLGHLFEDGPAPTGKRFCINSASLRFMPREQYQAWLAKNSPPPATKK